MHGYKNERHKQSALQTQQPASPDTTTCIPTKLCSFKADSKQRVGMETAADVTSFASFVSKLCVETVSKGMWIQAYCCAVRGSVGEGGGGGVAHLKSGLH